MADAAHAIFNLNRLTFILSLIGNMGSLREQDPVDPAKTPLEPLKVQCVFAIPHHVVTYHHAFLGRILGHETGNRENTGGSRRISQTYRVRTGAEDKDRTFPGFFHHGITVSNEGRNEELE